MKILIDHRNHRHYIGSSLISVIAQVPNISFDKKKRILTIRGSEDTVSFSPELEGMNLEGVIADRAYYILRRDYGYEVFYVL
jgi:hypothetical protein